MPEVENTDKVKTYPQELMAWRGSIKKRNRISDKSDSTAGRALASYIVTQVQSPAPLWDPSPTRSNP